MNKNQLINLICTPVFILCHYLLYIPFAKRILTDYPFIFNADMLLTVFLNLFTVLAVVALILKLIKKPLLIIELLLGMSGFLNVYIPFWGLATKYLYYYPTEKTFAFTGYALNLSHAQEIMFYVVPLILAGVVLYFVLRRRSKQIPVIYLFNGLILAVITVALTGVLMIYNLLVGTLVCFTLDISIIFVVIAIIVFSFVLLRGGFRFTFDKLKEWDFEYRAWYESYYLGGTTFLGDESEYISWFKSRYPDGYKRKK